MSLTHETVSPCSRSRNGWAGSYEPFGRVDRSGDVVLVSR